MIAVIRFALYVDLMLLFGLPAFILYNAREAAEFGSSQLTWTSRALALLAPLLSVLGFAQLCADMAGLSLADLDWTTVEAVLWATPIGTACLVRMAALAAYLTIVIFPRNIGQPRALALVATGSVSEATLAWGGHGAGGDWTRLIADIVHLLSAGIWLGALGAFVLLLTSARPSGKYPRLLLVMLRRFALVGTLTVTAIVASGLINAWQLVGLQQIPHLLTSPYGRALTAKLLVFVMMLALAAANRLRLTPQLERSLAGIEQDLPLTSLRKSIAVETTMAMIVLALVAYLGLLEPPNAGL